MLIIKNESIITWLHGEDDEDACQDPSGIVFRHVAQIRICRVGEIIRHIVACSHVLVEKSQQIQTLINPFWSIVSLP